MNQRDFTNYEVMAAYTVEIRLARLHQFKGEHILIPRTWLKSCRSDGVAEKLINNIAYPVRNLHFVYWIGMDPNKAIEATVNVSYFGNKGENGIWLPNYLGMKTGDMSWRHVEIIDVKTGEADLENNIGEYPYVFLSSKLITYLTK